MSFDTPRQSIETPVESSNSLSNSWANDFIQSINPISERLSSATQSTATDDSSNLLAQGVVKAPDYERAPSGPSSYDRMREDRPSQENFRKLPTSEQILRSALHGPNFSTPWSTQPELRPADAEKIGAAAAIGAAIGGAAILGLRAGARALNPIPQELRKQSDK
ncbi:MAG: hypothetical protein K2Z81_14755 [Cyanobacteria bacterium]|nr:hypothetical protein [Cyanobacteriota bacterium]